MGKIIKHFQNITIFQNQYISTWPCKFNSKIFFFIHFFLLESLFHPFPVFLTWKQKCQIKYKPVIFKSLWKVSSNLLLYLSPVQLLSSHIMLLTNQTFQYFFTSFPFFLLLIFCSSDSFWPTPTGSLDIQVSSNMLSPLKVPVENCLHHLKHVPNVIFMFSTIQCILYSFLLKELIILFPSKDRF